MASIVARRSSDMQRTLSLDERRVAKVLNGVHADDLGAMQNVAMDLVNSVRLSDTRSHGTDATPADRLHLHHLSTPRCSSNALPSGG